MKSHNVDVIMAVYDETVEVIHRAVISMTNQTRPPSSIIIVADNPDNASALDYLASVAAEQKNIVLLKNPKRIGLGFSLNRAIEASRAEFVARMDADDVSMPTRLEKQMEFMLSHPSIDICFTGYQLIRGSGVITPELDDTASFRSHLFTAKYNHFKHASYLAKHSVIEQLKYRISRPPEDFDLYVRLSMAGFKEAIIPEPLYLHYIEEKNSYRSGREQASRELLNLVQYAKILARYPLSLIRWNGYVRQWVRISARMAKWASYNLLAQR